MLHVGLYLGAVVGANLFVTWLGPKASILSAFLMIGATLTIRDRLHDRWQGRGLLLRMGGLIATGGVLSVALSGGMASRIALASMVAFVLSETVDALTYARLRDKPWMLRANGSNTLAAAVDSLTFPALAFGGFLPLIVLGQFAAKVLGGWIWSRVLRPAAVLVLLLGTGSSAQAQVVALNGAWMHNAFVDAPVGEVFVAAPEVFKLRPYAIVSWNTDGDERPTILVRVGHTCYFKYGAVGVGAGVLSLPFDRTPRPSLSVIAFGPGKNLRPYALAAYEKTPEWGWTVFGGLTYTLYFRK